VTVSFVMSVRLPIFSYAWNNLAPTGQNIMKFDIWGFFKKYVENIQIPLKSNKNKGYFT
jgi:hypothetical protein